MADEAGPSTVPSVVEAADLKQAEEKFGLGVECIRSNDLEQAVQLFAEVLKVRSTHYGVLARECASAYYRYGSALFYQAQDSADVFGGPINGTATGEEDDKENDEADRVSAEQPAEGGVAADEEDKGKGPAITAEEEEDNEDEIAEEGDIQLAWENLETARTIWARDPDANRAELASVHTLLGDVSMEKEQFEDSLAEYDASLEHYAAMNVGEDDRRLAEVQYKRACVLQFLERPDEALAAVKTAVEVLKNKKASLKSTGVLGNEEATKTLEDVEAVLEELNEKVEELETAAKEEAAMRTAMRGAMAQLQNAMAASGAAPSVTGAKLDAPSAGASPVKDLGVVGRGTKRINLAPVAAAPAGAPAAEAEADGGTAQPMAKKKRSLEDLMGGGPEGETAVGFGDAASKQEENQLQPPAAEVPAFLRVLAQKEAANGGTAQ